VLPVRRTLIRRGPVHAMNHPRGRVAARTRQQEPDGMAPQRRRVFRSHEPNRTRSQARFQTPEQELANVASGLVPGADGFAPRGTTVLNRPRSGTPSCPGRPSGSGLIRTRHGSGGPNRTMRLHPRTRLRGSDHVEPSRDPGRSRMSHDRLPFTRSVKGEGAYSLHPQWASYHRNHSDPGQLGTGLTAQNGFLTATVAARTISMR
jgi:hypothetical protein